MAKKKYHTEEERKAANVAKVLKYRNKHRERFNAYRRKYAQENPERIRGYMQKWYYKNHEATLEYHKSYRISLRDETIAAYGGCCSCCKEKQKEFLTIDHVHGYAKRPHLYSHSKKQRGGTHLYLWLRKNNFPQRDFTCLCWNCNLSKAKYGYCPHVGRE